MYYVQEFRLFDSPWVLYDPHGVSIAEFVWKSDLIKWLKSHGHTAEWRPHWAGPSNAKIVGRMR